MKELISFLRWANYDDHISEIKELVQLYNVVRSQELASAEAGNLKASEIENIKPEFNGKFVDKIDVGNERKSLI